VILLPVLTHELVMARKLFAATAQEGQASTISN